MSKVTAKLQVTIPKAIARQYGIEPGSEVTFEPAGDVIRFVPGPVGQARQDLDPEVRRAAVARVRQGWEEISRSFHERYGDREWPEGRDWTRDELYEDRGVRR
jgi:AbrB family looped-hinge helix DNA binding protein